MIGFSRNNTRFWHRRPDRRPCVSKRIISLARRLKESFSKMSCATFQSLFCADGTARPCLTDEFSGSIKGNVRLEAVPSAEKRVMKDGRKEGMEERWMSEWMDDRRQEMDIINENLIELKPGAMVSRTII